MYGTRGLKSSSCAVMYIKLFDLIWGKMYFYPVIGLDAAVKLGLTGNRLYVIIFLDCFFYCCWRHSDIKRTIWNTLCWQGMMSQLRLLLKLNFPLIFSSSSSSSCLLFLAGKLLDYWFCIPIHVTTLQPINMC